jgi:hypothetical protein
MKFGVENKELKSSVGEWIVAYFIASFWYAVGWKSKVVLVLN